MAKKSTKSPLPLPLLAVIAAILIIIVVFLSMKPGEKQAVCGDDACDGAETCSSCPQDCGACVPVCGDGACGSGETEASCPQDCAPVFVGPPIELPETVICNFSTNAEAHARASAENRLDYCNCIDSESLKESCKRSVADSTAFTTAMYTFDVRLCDNITNPYAKESCTSIILDAVDQLIQEDPLYFIYLYANTQNYDEAIPLLEDLLAEDPDNYGALIGLAILYSDKSWAELGSGEYTDKAMNAITRALEVNPNSAVGYRIQAQVYKARGEVDKAIESYNRSLQIDPDFIDAYVGRAHAYRMMGAYLLALDDLNKAKELDPDRERIDIYLQLCVLLSGEDDRAEEALDNCEIVVSSPSPVFTAEKSDAHLEMAYLYMRAGKYVEAMDNLEASLTYQPENANTHTQLAELYNRQRNFTLAQESAEEAISLDPQKTKAYVELSYALYGQGKFQDAIAKAMKGLELADSDPGLLGPQKEAIKQDLYYILATVYRDMGDSANEAKYKGLGDAIVL